MSERTDDDRMVEWIEKKREHGYYVLTREELAQRIDEACTDAYAEGRSDQNAEHSEGIAVLAFAAEQLSSDWPERCQEIVRRARGLSATPPSFDKWWEQEGQYGSPFDLRAAFKAGGVAQAVADRGKAAV